MNTIPNDPPIAVDDEAATAVGTDVIIDLLSNDSDPDGDAIHFYGVPTATNGWVETHADGTITYHPNPGFEGVDTFVYTIQDANGATATATVTVTVGDVEPQLDGIVQGTDGDDLIDIAYTGDPHGDMIDHLDEILPGEGPNDDIVIAGDGNDTVISGEGNDDVQGGAGDDVIDTSGSTPVSDHPVRHGDPSPDHNPNDDRDFVDGGTGDDTITTGDDADTVMGGEGNDTIDSGIDDDIVDGGVGDDTITAGDGNDTVVGGDGDDVIDTSGSTPLSDHPAVFGDASPDGNPFDDMDFVDGGAGNDTITTGDDADRILGGTGDDIIDAGIDDDSVDGGEGNDTIIGGDGNDLVNGGAGDDVIDTSGDNPASDYGWALAGLDPDSNPFDDRDTVDGGEGDDVITTGDDQDVITGGAGNDEIDGGLDDDRIDGGADDDTIIGGHGADTIDGGTGDDVIWGGMGPGTDPFNIPDVDQPGDAFPFADPVTDNGIDVIHGGDGNDTIYGQDDADELYGDDGDDIIDGGIDNDLIDGGAGNDTLMGGADEDTFVNLNAGDTVDGGSEGVDHDILDLTGSAPAGGSLNVTYTGPDSNGNGFDGYVTYYDDMGNVTGTLDFEEIEEVIPCFTPGTMIATPKGERLVEELREGDKVITRDNGIQEIRWAGTKKLGWKALTANAHLKPVLIREGSLGNGLPERDILVSPNHRVLVANDRTALYFEEREVLVAAKHLVDNKGVQKVEDAMGISYIHFMFDHHEVVLSNGAWTESFQPGDYSLKGIGNAQRTEIFELFPELESVEGIEEYSAARRTLKKHEAKILLK